jgi:hypothetical protein
MRSSYPDRPMQGRAVFAVSVASALLFVACGSGDERPPVEPAHRTPPAAEISELEIRGSGANVDRFALCPPPGELGQQWFPAPPQWTPPPVSGDAGSVVVDQDFIARTAGRSPTELAVEATHRDFRTCYRRTLTHGASPTGRVAIVLRVGPDGKVAKVEEYAACEIDPEAIACMKGVAARLRFPPPAGGSDTITIPATFTSREGLRRTSATTNDAYTASAYVTLEGARAALHECDAQARREGRALQATGTFTMNVAANGRVTRTHIDPYTGERTLLECAARAFDQLAFAPPPGGQGVVIARLNFNPRQGLR